MYIYLYIYTYVYIYIYIYIAVLPIVLPILLPIVLPTVLPIAWTDTQSDQLKQQWQDMVCQVLVLTHVALFPSRPLRSLTLQLRPLN